MNDLEDLTKTYGPMAPFSEHKKGDHITYTSAEGLRSSGTIVWVQAATESIPMKYVVAPDDGGFLDFALPGDIVNIVTQDAPAADDLTECPYCKGLHPRSQVEHCPLNPRKG